MFSSVRLCVSELFVGMTVIVVHVVVFDNLYSNPCA